VVRRALGSNQYRTRAGADPALVPDGDLMGEMPTPLVRCGEVWGTRCRAWVIAPGYSHGDHGRRQFLLDGFNPDCPPDVLSHLTQHEDFSIAVYALRHANCPAEVAAQRAADAASPQVRAAALEHRGCPPPVLLEATKRCSAIKDRQNYHELQAISGNPNTPTDALWIIASNDGALFATTLVFYKTVEHPNASPAVLMQAMQSATKRGAMAVAVPTLLQHPQCPPEVLLQLAKKAIWRRQAMEHPNMPEEYRALHQAVQ
jgi:hypothetical protein